jgi:ABC-2 type transport system ATP-binding protein
MLRLEHRTGASMNAVELDNVSKSFGQHLAVDRLSLRVGEGSIYGFIGPNGAGKTTTLRMILNIFEPDSGALRLFGEPLRGARDPRLGYLPEERGLYRAMKVREHLAFIGELKTGRSVLREVDAWLDRFELSAWANKKVQMLSKGMAQKVQFIAAVLGEPRLLVLDEPFSGLDPVNMDALRRAVLDLRSRGVTLVFSTHDMAMAERMCDFIFMIFRGRKVLDGTLASIQDTYGSDTVRLRTNDGAAALNELPGVEQVDDFGQVQELRLGPGADPQRLLTILATRTRIRLFEVTKPSLHDIFLRIAGPAAQETSAATASAPAIKEAA